MNHEQAVLPTQGCQTWKST